MSFEDDRAKLRHMSDGAVEKKSKKLIMSSEAKEFVPKNRIMSDDLIIVNNERGNKYGQALTDVLNDEIRTDLDYLFNDAGYESHFSCGNVSECAVNEGDMSVNEETFGSHTAPSRPSSLQVNNMMDNTVYHPLPIQNPTAYTMDHAVASYAIYGNQTTSLVYNNLSGQDMNNYGAPPVLQVSSSPMVVQQTPTIGVFRSYHNSGGSSPHSYQSVSPPIITATNNVSSTTIGGEHYVMVHVNLGETFSIRVGDQIQNISGPATVRMVSNSGPPTPMPMQVPPGHMVQQIVDENGILTHVILSPLHQPNQYMGPQIHQQNNQSNFYPPSQNNSSMSMYSKNYNTFNNGTNIPQSNKLNNCSEGVAPLNSNIDIGLPDQSNKSRTTICRGNNKDKLNHSDFNGSSSDIKPRQIRPRVHQYHHPSQPEESNHYVKSRTSHTLSTLASDTNNVDKSLANSGYSNHSHYSKIRKKRPFSNASSANIKHHYVQDQASSPASSADEATTILTDEEKNAIRDVINNIEQPEVSEIEARSALIHILAPAVPENSVVTINPADFIFQLHFAERNPDSRYNCVFYGEAVEISLQDLKPATVYYIKVCCIYENITGNLSQANKFTTSPSEPNQPKTLQDVKIKSRNSVQLKWSSPVENGSKIIDYVVEYCRADHTTDNFIPGYSGSLKTCKISKLKPSTEYLFRLAAINSLGQSPWSDPLSITTSGTAPLPPDPPIMARADIGGLLLTWKKRQTDDTFCLEMMDEATGYGFITVFNGPEVEHYVENLRRNTSYRFHLAASNQDGRSRWSEVVTISTKPDLPSHPLKLHVRGKISPTQFVLVWDPPEDDGGRPVTSYKLELDVTTADITDSDSERDWVVVYEGVEREYHCKSLVPGSTVLARVSAKSSMGAWGSPCGHVNVHLTAVVPGQMVPPRKDVGNKCKGGLFTPGSVNLLWEKPENDGGSAITSYEVCQWLLRYKSKVMQTSASNINVITEESQSEETEEQVVYNGDQLQCQISGLIPGAQYRYRIRAINKAGNGKWSDCQDVTSGPSAPEGPSEAPVVTFRSAHVALVTWQSPVQANGSQIIEYHLEMMHKSDVNAEFQLVYTGASLSYELKNLQPDSQYRFRVQAINRAGTSPYSPVCDITTPASVPSQVIGVHTGDITMHSIQLLWKEPLCHGSTIINYSIEVTYCSVGTVVVAAAGGGTTAAVNNLSVTDSFTLSSESTDRVIGDLLPDTNYKFRVQAMNSVGCGAFSSLVKASTLSAPPAPPRLDCVTVQSNSIKLRWHNDNSARQYYINRLRLSPTSIPCKSATISGSHSTTELPVTQYQLQMSKQPDSGWSSVYTGPLQFHKLGKLLESTGYYFRIMASNDMGDGDFSEPYLIVTEKAAPSPVRAPRVLELAMDSCLIEWPAVRSMNYDPIVYILQLLTISEKDCDYRQLWKNGTEVYRGSDTTCRLSNLSSGTEYMTRVCAVRLCSPSTIECDKVCESPIHVQKTIHELHKNERTKTKDNSSPVTELLGAFSKSVAFTTSSSGNIRPPNFSSQLDNRNNDSRNCDKSPSSFLRNLVPLVVTDWFDNLGPWTDSHATLVLLAIFAVVVIMMSYFLQSYVK